MIDREVGMVVVVVRLRLRLLPPLLGREQWNQGVVWIGTQGYELRDDRFGYVRSDLEMTCMGFFSWDI